MQRQTPEDSSSGDLELGVPGWGVAIAVIVILAILGIFVAFLVLLSTIDFSLV